MELAILFVRGTLAWLLITAGVQKVWGRDGASNEGNPEPLTARFPRRLVTSVAVAEVMAGLALFAPVIWPAGAIVAVALFGAFTVVVGIAARRGQGGDCGCGGLLPAQQVSYRHAALTGAGAMLGGLAAIAGLIDPSAGNLSRAGGVGGMVLALGWAPLATLLAANAARYVVGARRMRQGIDRRVWTQRTVATSRATVAESS
jgi:uncharacterized membrane protein YphA (DoxX/SURF4 family)